MNTKIIAILMAGIVAMAIGVPMAMGDSATQSAEVTLTYTVEIRNADASAALGAWTFPSGGAGQTATVSSQAPTSGTPTCTIYNPSGNNGNIDVDIYGSAFTSGSNTFACGTYEKTLIRDDAVTTGITWGTVGTYVANAANVPDEITNLGVGVHKDVYFQLTLGSDSQAAGSYTSTYSAISSLT